MNYFKNANNEIMAYDDKQVAQGYGVGLSAITELEKEAIINPPKTEAELLEIAKAGKLTQIENDYIASEEQTVEVSGVIYFGGTSSVEAIDSYVRLNRLAGNTTHNIWDINGTDHTLTDIEADSVILAIGVQASINKLAKKNRKVALAVATTITEVEAV